MDFKLFSSDENLQSRYPLSFFDVYPLSILSFYANLQMMATFVEKHPKLKTKDFERLLFDFFSVGFDLRRSFIKTGNRFQWSWIEKNSDEISIILSEAVPGFHGKGVSALIEPEEALTRLESIDSAGRAFLVQDTEAFDSLKISKNERILGCLNALLTELRIGIDDISEYHSQVLMDVVNGPIVFKLFDNIKEPFRRLVFGFIKQLSSLEAISSYYEKYPERDAKVVIQEMEKFMGQQ